MDNGSRDMMLLVQAAMASPLFAYIIKSNRWKSENIHNLRGRDKNDKVM